MKNSTTVRILTLVTFIILVAGFVAFKTGAFNVYLDKERKESPSVDSYQEPTADTIPLTDSLIISPAMLPTSKSLILTEQEVKFLKQDTLKADDGK